MKDVTYHPSSFRDPAGFVFEQGGTIYRQINKTAQDDFDHLMDSGLYKKLVSEDLLVPHEEVKEAAGLGSKDKCYKIIKPSRIPFISYPYEWTFAQIRDAGLLTLKIQKIALEHGMILKDASAYNVQFVGKKPVFIDTLSFKIYEKDSPWEGYRQFCEHFVAPLAISAYKTPELLRSLRVFLDGFPLPVTTGILSGKGRLRRGLSSHLYLHAASIKRYKGGHKAAVAKKRKLSKLAMDGLLASLERTLKNLKLPNQKTQWGDYYSDTNYSDNSFKHKETIVRDQLKKINPLPKTAWDLGANDGTFSRLAADLGAYTVAFDIDTNAVGQNYSDKTNKENILPLVQDLANPSPGLGWAHSERFSLEQRGPADVAIALALIHHLAITNHSPFSSVAEFFARISKHLIIEFVPKEDSKVQMLLSTTRNPYSEYDQKHFEAAFAIHFKLIDRQPIQGSHRLIYLYKAKG